MRSYQVEPYLTETGSLMKLDYFYCESLEELREECFRIFPEADYCMAVDELTEEIYMVNRRSFIKIYQ